ncbi:DinB family protein [Tunturiibacter empetritectus]|uniref:Damage-inducible protein DinB n=2 Tax=Tunturiibacter TaxID=3154218 RepID=A0A852VP21_9BACT|nr:DinB family protein [Edaphobacter lichenicola]NYF91346.1 putative damage-inducible protein DinB [Edaphobacter lichenicola]
MELNPYAKNLDGNDPIPVLASTSKRLHTLTTGLTYAQLTTPPAPGKWSITNIVTHLADTELVFSFRLRQTLAPALDQPHHIIQPFDQDAWAQRYAVYPLEPALALFDAIRNWNLLFLATVSDDDRHRPATHPERGTMTLWTIVETMAGHDLNHLQQLERLAQIGL